jgi:hypothetical protein
MEGGGVTVRLAVLLGAPATASPARVAPLVVLGRVPAVLLVTVRVMVQPASGTLPAVTAKLVTPAAALLVTPVQVPPTAPLASCILESVSVKARPVTAAPVPLMIWKLIVEVAPEAMVDGLKDLTMPSLPTVRVAVAVPPGPALAPVVVLLTCPVVLVYAPAVALCTLTVMEQVAPTASAPPASTRLPVPAAAVTVPPQVFVTPGTGALTRLPGVVG